MSEPDEDNLGDFYLLETDPHDGLCSYGGFLSHHFERCRGVEIAEPGTTAYAELLEACEMLIKELEGQD